MTMKMTNKQYLLIKLAEEATEVAQMALKTAQFGPTERYPKDPRNNQERLSDEYTDLVAIVEMLFEEENVKLHLSHAGIRNKKAKVAYYRRTLLIAKREGYWINA